MAIVFRSYWGASDADSYYGTTAQVIATMYVAVAIEFFTGGGVEFDARGRIEFLLLLAVSWLGLLASLQAVSGNSEDWTSAIAAAGVVASVFLVTTALGRRVILKNEKLVKPIIYMAAFAPVLITLVP